MCPNSYSGNVWRSSFSKIKSVLKKLQHMREGKSLFENKSQIRFAILFNSNYFPWEGRTLTRVAGIGRGGNHWVIFVSYYLHKLLRLYTPQAKKISEFEKRPREVFCRQDKCFPLNIAKFLRAPILKKIFEQRLPQFLLLAVIISS